MSNFLVWLIFQHYKGIASLCAAIMYKHHLSKNVDSSKCPTMVYPLLSINDSFMKVVAGIRKQLKDKADLSNKADAR